MVKSFVMSKGSTSQLAAMRHTAAHVLAAAVKDLWPGTHNAIGPAIEDGFYQDFDFGERKVSEADFPVIEARMHELLKTWGSFAERDVSAEEARHLFADNPYKLELLENLAREGKTIHVNDPGNFLDLCRGGHSPQPAKDVQHFKLLSLAGAYWRGDANNKMLTRIYGTAFFSKNELDDYLRIRDEAKKRDHKVLGPQLELFMFHSTAPGMPYWLPRGVTLYNELVNFWRIEHQARGYQEIVSPLLNKKDLYVTSGHFEHYWSDMFTTKTAEGEEEYGLKAMNCPNAMIVYGSKSRSYRDLPLRLSDTDPLHRNELSGTLNGLLRVREFRQDDAHIFVTEEDIGPEYQRVFEIVERFYSIFGMSYTFRLGTRPEKFMGESVTWNKAEATLKDILEASGKQYVVAEGDGAFYGPKVDILMKDVLGREWQMGTIQLDFQQPARFGLEYTAADGSKKTPVAIHRVVYGSLERFVGILIEHYAGAFPLWLSPVQVAVLPISDEQNDYAASVAEELKKVGIRVEVNSRSESIGKKIREAQTMKTPVMLIVGKKEVADGVVSLRSRDKGDEGSRKLEEVVAKLKKQIEERK